MGLHPLLVIMNISEELKIFLHQEQEKIWEMDGKQEEVGEKNFDWLIIKCATIGKIKKIQIDTHHFKGNYPDMCSLQAAYLNGKISAKSIVNKSKKWKLLLNKVKLHAHKKHNFQNKLMRNKKVNYIKINIFPDGGISRIRVFGRVE